MISYNDLLTACEQQEKEIENLKEELAQAHSDSERNNQLMIEVANLLDERRKEVENLKKQLENKNREIAATNKLLEKATEKISKLGIQITQQAGTIARFNTTVDNMISKIEEL